MVIPTALEIFYLRVVRKATILVIPTVLEIFYQEFVRKATVLVIPQEFMEINIGISECDKNVDNYYGRNIGSHTTPAERLAFDSVEPLHG